MGVTLDAVQEALPEGLTVECELKTFEGGYKNESITVEVRDYGGQYAVTVRSETGEATGNNADSLEDAFGNVELHLCNVLSIESNGMFGDLCGGANQRTKT